MDESATLRTRVLDAAEALFYARGLQTVGMDEIRTTAGVSLKRLYQLFPSKECLVRAYLHRRDAHWRAKLAEYVDARPSAGERIPAVFDWLHLWFSEPGFRGCAFINAFGELGATSDVVAEATRTHKEAFRRYVAGLVAAVGAPAALADQIALLAEGAMTTAAVSGSPEPARQGRAAARTLLEAALTRSPAGAAARPS
ncbi:TetR/AcrR family transcriptional regulator [Kitasatospora sp. NPDC050543]|uniref:TetR/AcrR family transcriptional regulator n=1 Tax=Kitasatospora sp. NPDC050543 TaxID=3364054 RepID=UPI0037B8E925